MNTTSATDFLQLPLAEMEARLTRFETQVNAAQRAAPPSKAWVRQALKRQGPGRCPVRLKRLSLDVALRHDQALAERSGARVLHLHKGGLYEAAA